MINLKDIRDRIKNKETSFDDSAEWDNELILEFCDELQYLRITAKGCCCEDGTVPATIESYAPDNPFPQMGSVICNTCHGLNVLVKMNQRQRAEILALYEQLDNVRAEREKLAELLVKK